VGGSEPAEAVVDCNEEAHRLVWSAGSLRAIEHPDLGGERALAGIGGTRYPCVDLLDAWERHADDLIVLLLAGRGPADVLAAEDEQRRQMRGRPGVPEDPLGEVMDLLRLGVALADRLVATVSASVAADTRRPRLHAALYGRVLAAMRTWLGQPRLAIELDLLDGSGQRSLRLDGDTVYVTLPFVWLSEVWVRGFTTILGRFCLAAESPDGRRWTLSTVGPDFADPEPIVLELPTGDT
jgi:hypothetical protein